MLRKFFYLAFLLSGVIYLSSCGGESAKSSATESGTTAEKPAASTEDYDPNRGEGKFDETNVVLGPLDAAMATKGKDIADTKCTSCHKMTDERLVGPGWKGVTERRTPHWIMNFISNPDPMIDKDPELMAQLELCLVRMPNQNLSDDEAREILEYMRQNDGAK
ncbi:MAG: cytochrome c [Saprospiraceae bacterium]|nr:MAG: cytochrome C [Bacteroidetes bacterium OLB9]MCO6464858.1 cytochrome c [Saprospiraceae bacterium]MCZ2339919.1 cytochrome c [Chitinophagales bacterium]